MILIFLPELKAVFTTVAYSSSLPENLHQNLLFWSWVVPLCLCLRKKKKKKVKTLDVAIGNATDVGEKPQRENKNSGTLDQFLHVLVNSDQYHPLWARFLY